MKSILCLSLLSVLFLSGCACDGYYGASYGYYDRPSYYSQPYQTYQTRQPYRHMQPYPHEDYRAFRQRVGIGPQYYRARINTPPCARFKNYTETPIVLDGPRGSKIIPPAF